MFLFFQTFSFIFAICQKADEPLLWAMRCDLSVLVNNKFVMSLCSSNTKTNSRVCSRPVK